MCDGFQQSGEGRALYFLEEFGEVIGEGSGPVAEDLEGVFEKGGQTMGAFVEDEGVGGVLVEFQEAAAGARLARGKAAKGEAVGREAGENQGHDEGCGPRCHGQWDLSFNGLANEGEARIRDARRAGIGDEGNGFALLKQADDAPTGLLFIVFMEGDLWLSDVIVLEEDACFSGILAGNDVYLA